MSQKKPPFTDVNPQPNFSAIEEEIIAYWKREKIFEQSVDFREHGDHGKNEYVFYDGPPFANGLPHYGHILTGFVKDIVPRYETMRGRRVERRFGWDCHGLPAEMEAEKDLNISGRQQIVEYGVDKFNAYCEKSVLRYTKEWESYVTRQARWVDFKNDYKTMDLPYMESVMWAFKEIYKKGLIYEGFKVMPYSWACETPLSNFEIRLDNSFRPRQDPAVTVAFSLLPTASDPDPIKLLVWTTTPWTLPSNLGIAVGADIDYAVFKEDGVRYVLAEGVIEKYENELKKAQKIGSLKGRELVGRSYTPLFPYFKNAPNAFKIMAGDFVSTEEGTGSVHMAPGFGEDDQKLCEANSIELVVPVDHRGRFTAEVPDYEGKLVFDANKDIIKALKDKGDLVKHETYTHNYPHCWRTDTPIIYRALNSWYVEVSKFKDRMVELNQKINWIPDHIRDGQFGRWLSNARDWSISRNRFWGAPIPVWVSDNPKFPRTDVYGSLDEIEKDFGKRPTNLHRPYIDQFVRPNPDDPSGKSMMRRVEPVLDCWFESGSMPFAQVHYPFENKQWFEDHSPADFIVEYVAQTRGWFYTLMVLGTVLFDCPPFSNCVCHGVVLDENKQKLSKRLKNYPSPEEVFSKYGADALRWFMCSSQILRGNDLQIDKEGKAIGEIVRTILNPIWNAYYFLTLYANSDQIAPEFNLKSTQLIDRYILAKTRALVASVTERMDAYDIPGACQVVAAYIDALNNWYIRRSRERFWKHEKDQDKTDAYNTLYSVLCILCRTVAPLLPLISEAVYRGLTGEKSVHLANWPEADKIPDDKALACSMDSVREVCSSALAIREAHSLRTRLPLQTLTVVGKSAASLKSYSDLIREELNVKQVAFSEKLDDYASFRLDVNWKKIGPRLGEAVKKIGAAVKSGKWTSNPDGSVQIEDVKLNPDEFEMALVAKEGASQVTSSREFVVLLDVKPSQELQDEGLARDLIRLVQESRKKAGFHVSDHIRLELELTPELQTVVQKHQELISEQTLSNQVDYKIGSAQHYLAEAELNEKSFRLGLSKL